MYVIAVLLAWLWRERCWDRERLDLIDRLTATSVDDYLRMNADRSVEPVTWDAVKTKVVEMNKKEKDPTFNEAYSKQREERVQQGRPGVY